jgi:acetyl-CoA acyltransferase
MAALLAGFPVRVPGVTVNRLCGSGMEAVVAAARAVAIGEAEICIAGGSESMTRAPFVLPRPDRPFPRDPEVVDSRLGWRLVNPAMEERFPPITLGQTAERVAEERSVSRERQDAFAHRSHQRAHAAATTGRWDDEVVPLPGPTGPVVADECVRPDTTLERLAALPPAFAAGGTVTAGNSSPMNDGAAAMIVCSEDAARRIGVEPLARYVGSSVAGVHPDLMGLGPVPATEQALARAGWSIDDIELAEVNEAFASQAIAVVDDLGLDEDLVNISGGAIALGHPLGCSGARIVTTLLHGMRRVGARRGLATMCIGVGQGITTLLERP